MNVMAAICNSFSGRRSFASLTRSPRLNERAPAEEAASDIIKNVRTIFETLDTRLLDALCDVNTEGKHDVKQKHSKWLWRKKSWLTRSIAIKLPVINYCGVISFDTMTLLVQPTIRLRFYGRNTSKEGSLRRRK